MSETIKYREKELIDGLRTLLLEGCSRTQDDLCKALRQKGYNIRQSKLSRLLHQLNVSKEKNQHGEFVYRLPHEPAPLIPSSRLNQLVISIVANEIGVVVHCNPGSASLLARLLDYNREQNGILGTLAGDDTIWVIPKSIHNTSHVLQKVKELLR